MKAEGLVLPCVLLERGGTISTVLQKTELDDFGGDPTRFETALGKNLAPLI